MAGEYKTYQKYVELTFDYDRMMRSQIIYEATALEGQIENIIASHFCPDEDKHLSFVSLLFNRAEVPFSKKIDILEFLLKQHYPDILNELPGLINKLNSVRRLRNKFAHAELVLDEDKLNEIPKGVYLRSVDRDGKVTTDFMPADEGSKRITNANSLGFFIFFLYLEIQKRAKGEEHNQFAGVFKALKRMYPDTFAVEAHQAVEVPAAAEPAKGSKDRS